MIVVEGPDNSGKTTLLKTISDAFKVVPVHSGGPSKTPNSSEIFERTEMYLDSDTKLFDRFPCISDQVYAPIFRGVNYFNEERGQQLFYKFLQKKPLIIYCRPPDSVMLNLSHHEWHPENETREHYEQVQANQFKVIQSYDALMHKINALEMVPMVQYDWTQEDNILLQKILQVSASIIQNRKH